MSAALDSVAAGCVVLLAICYALYALGPVKLKTWVLQQIGKYLGIRVLSFMLKRQTGCNGCAAAGKPHPIGKQSARS